MRHSTRRSVLKGIGAGSAVGITALAGCTGDGGDGGGSDGGDGGGGDGGDGGSTGTPGDMGPTEFTTGVFSPFTGPFAPWGPAMELGARLAAEDLMSEFDIDITINTYDTEVNPSAALERMQRAVTADGVDFTQGALSSAVCTSIGTWASDNGVIYVADGASDTLTGSNCKPFMFRTYSSNTMMSRSAVPRMAEIADSWYILYSDYVWGQNAQGTISELLEQEGSSVAGKDATPFPHDDYTQYLNNAANSDADGLAMVLPGLEPVKAMNQARNQGNILDRFSIMMHQNEDMTQVTLGSWSVPYLDVAPTGWVNSAEGGEDFKQRIAEQGELPPFVRHFSEYVATDQVVRAALRAGSKEAEDIRDELEGHEITNSNVKAIESGTLRWRACDHQLEKPTYVISGRSESELVNDPYRQWFNIEQKTPASEVIRACDQTGCSF